MAQTVILQRRLVLALVGLTLAACANQPDPIATDVESAKDRTVPPGGHITSSYSWQRDRQSARASWEIETELAWNAYAAWVEPRMGKYRLVERGQDRLRFTQQLEGDYYSLVLVAKPSSKSHTIEVSFEATPF